MEELSLLLILEWNLVYKISFKIIFKRDINPAFFMLFKYLYVMKKAYLNWSSGKDAAYALHVIQQQKEFSVEKLVTTINSESNRVSMHGLRRELLLKQAESIGIPLQLISLPGNVPMQTYNKIMEQETRRIKSRRIQL